MKTSLLQKLNGERPLGVYFESWTSKWCNSGINLDLANIQTSINIVFLSFVEPSCSYVKNSMSWSGSGLNFSSDFSVVKSAINILRNRNCVVMLSVGGATFPFTNTYNPVSIVDLATDLGVDGIDIDWEPSNGAAASSELGTIIGKLRNVYSDGLLSIAAFSVGAYGSNSQPASQNTGMCISGLKSNGYQLDFINLMSYDASNVYNPIEAFKSYRSYFNGPILIGTEVPPEAWGGHILTTSEVETYARYAITDNVPGNGLFVWSYQKAGIPSSISIISTAFNIFSNSSVQNTNVPTPVVVPKPPTHVVKPPVVVPKPPTTVPVPNWKQNVLYKIGDIIIYNNNKYKCIQSHTSIITWEPSIYTQALWTIVK